MKQISGLIHRLVNLGITESTPLALARPISLANGINLFMLSLVPIWITAELVLGSPDANTRQFSLLLMSLMLIIAAVHLIISALGLTHMARILLVLDIPILIFLFPAFTGHLYDQDLLWYPYLMAGLSLLPQLVLTWKYERMLYLLGLIYMFLLVLFSKDILLSSLTEQGPVSDQVRKFEQYYLRTVISVWLMINLALFYMKRLLSARGEKLQAMIRKFGDITDVQ